MSRQANLVTATMATPRRIRPWQLWRPRGRTDHVIGFHIDSGRVYAVHTLHAGGAARIVNTYEADLEPGTILYDVIREPNRLIEALRKLHTQMAAHGVPRDARVVLLIDGHHVIVKRIFMSQMNDKEVEEAIHWEAEQCIPFDIRDVNLDWEPLVRDPELELDQREVLLIAAKNDAVGDLVQVVLNAGWMLDAVEFVGQGFKRLAGLQGQNVRDVAMAYVGDKRLHLVVTNVHGEIAFTRDITIGRNHIVEEVAKTLPCTLSEADTLVASFDRPEPCLDDTHELTRRICIAVIEQMALELQRTLAFYQTTSLKGQVSKICVCGRVADLPAFQHILQTRLEIPTSHLVLPDNVAHRFAVAAGLSLRTHFDDRHTARQADRERANMTREEKRTA